MAPRSNLEVTGDLRVRTHGGAEVLTVPARINCNARCPTLEQLEAQRMNLCVSLVDTLAKETCRDIAASALLPDFLARVNEDSCSFAREDFIDGFKDERCVHTRV